MKTTMNIQKQYAFVSKDAKLKGDEVVCDSLSSSSKGIECLYLKALENFHEWLKKKKNFLR